LLVVSPCVDRARRFNMLFQKAIVRYLFGIAAVAVTLCAEHVQQLGSESLLSDLMEVKD